MRTTGLKQSLVISFYTKSIHKNSDSKRTLSDTQIPLHWVCPTNHLGNSISLEMGDSDTRDDTQHLNMKADARSESRTLGQITHSGSVPCKLPVGLRLLSVVPATLAESVVS